MMMLHLIFWTKQFSEQNEFLVVEISGNNFMNSLRDVNSSIISNYEINYI